MKKNRLMVLTFLFMALGILFGSTSVRAADTYYTTDDGNYTFEVEEDGTANLHRYVGTETDVTVPATITGNGQTYEVSILGSHAFHQREDVLNVIVSEGIKEIQTGAFYYCSNLKTVKVPSTAKFYDSANNAFIGTDNLEYIDVDDDNQRCFDIDGVTFVYSITAAREIKLHRYPSAKPDTTYVIPEDTDYVGFDAFQNTKYLQKLVFPKYMTGVYIGSVVNPLNPIEIYLTTTNLSAYDDKCFNKLPAGSKVYVQTDALAEEAVRLLANSPDAEIVSLESNPDAGVPCTSLTFADGSTEKEVNLETGSVYHVDWAMEPYGTTDVLTWKSSDTTVAKVGGGYLKGNVYCYSSGTSVITITDQHGHTISLTVNVYDDVTGVGIERKNYIGNHIDDNIVLNFYSDSEYAESHNKNYEYLDLTVNTKTNDIYNQKTEYEQNSSSTFTTGNYNYEYNWDKIEIVNSNPEVLKIEKNSERTGYDIIPLSVGTATVYVNVTDYDGTVYKSNEITYVIKEDISEWRAWKMIELQDYHYMTESTLVPGTEVEESSYTYTGEEIEPKMVVKDHSGKVLVEGIDYIISELTDNVNAGYATFVVQGAGHYYGEMEYGFYIKKDISSHAITITKNGNTFTIKDGETELINGTDYDYYITYNGDGSGMSVKFYGIGDYYKGSITKYYNDAPSNDSGNTGGSDNSTNTGSNSDNNNDSTTNGSTDNSSNSSENTEESQNSTDTGTKKKQIISGSDSCTTVYRKNGKLYLNCKAKTTLTYTISNPKVATVDSKGKVTIKGTGACTITVTAKGTNKYEAATKTITIKVAPKKAVLSKVKSNKKKTITVSWKKDKLASGYQIQYAINKSFKKAKTVNVSGKKASTTIKKLKAGKKYYVRIRAYKTVKVEGKTEKIYGSYSGKKTVTVKR